MNKNRVIIQEVLTNPQFAKLSDVNTIKTDTFQSLLIQKGLTKREMKPNETRITLGKNWALGEEWGESRLGCFTTPFQISNNDIKNPLFLKKAIASVFGTPKISYLKYASKYDKIPKFQIEDFGSILIRVRNNVFIPKDEKDECFVFP